MVSGENIKLTTYIWDEQMGAEGSVGSTVLRNTGITVNAEAMQLYSPNQFGFSTQTLLATFLVEKSERRRAGYH